MQADPLLPSLAFAYAMSIGVRPGDEPRKERLQEVLDRRAGDLRAILLDFAVPLVPAS